MKPCVFGYRILETKYDSDSTFFQKKSYFIQLFQKQIIFYSTFSKKSNLEIRKQNKNSILISKIQHPNAEEIVKSSHIILLVALSVSFSYPVEVRLTVLLIFIPDCY